METVLEGLANLGSSGVLRAIEGYTRWYLVHAICWFAVGIAIMLCGYLLGKSKNEELDGWNALWRYVAMGVLMFIGVAIAMSNLATIFAPEAYAIHCFIGDIKP